MNRKHSHEQVPHGDQAATQAEAAAQPEANAADDARRNERPQSEPAVQTTAGTGSGEEADADMPVQTDAEGQPALKARLAKAEADLKTLSDRYLRLMAEYDNFRKRSQKEREALYMDSVTAVVKEWLPVVDNLGRAEQASLNAEGESARRIAEGVAMVLKQASDAMERLNIREIDCLGQTFDPQIADAVLHVDDDSAGLSTVVEILQKGYTCGDRIIRHCMVKVAN